MLDEEGNNPFDETQDQEETGNNAFQSETEDVEHVPSNNIEKELRPAATPEKVMMEQDEKNKKSKAWIVFLIILILAIIYSGFYVLKYVKNLENKQPQITTPTENIQAEEVALPPSEGEIGKSRNEETAKEEVDINPDKVKTPPPIKEPESEQPSEPKPEESSKPKNGVQVIGTPETKKPDEIVNDFYNWYSIQDTDVIADGSYKDRDGVAAGLIAKIDSSSKTKDPFLCTTKPVSGFEVEPAKTDGDSSIVAVSVKKSGEVFPVKISLKKNGSWKMINVTCLSQDGERGILETFKEDQGLDYLTVRNVQFYWNLPDWKGRESQRVNGKGLKTENAELTTDVKTFLETQGFKEDILNNGYKKGRTVCNYKDEQAKNGKHKFELNCGEIMYNY